MPHNKQYAQSAPNSPFQSASSSSVPSRPPSPPPEKPSMLRTIAKRIGLPVLAYGGIKWALNRPFVQAMITRYYNKGNRLVGSTYNQPEILALEAPKRTPPPEHTPMPKDQPSGIKD